MGGEDGRGRVADNPGSRGVEAAPGQFEQERTAMTASPFQIAATQFRAGQLDAAEATLKRALAKEGENAELLDLMGVVSHQQRRLEQAEYYFGRALKADPQLPAAHGNFANYLVDVGRFDEAIEHYQRAIAAAPERATGWIGLSAAYQLKGQIGRSVEAGLEALRRNPAQDTAYGNVAAGLVAMGRVEEAIGLLRQGLPRVADASAIAPMLVATLLYDWRITPEAVLADHVGYGNKLSDAQKPSGVPFVNRREPDRPLRIGYLSSDLRTHSVASFIRPILEHADRANYRSYGYQTSPEDGTSAQLRAMMEGWCNTLTMNDAALYERIRHDQIDILVELNGHTMGQRMAMVARRAAPVQVNYCGYAHSTGVREMDYRVVDAVTDPPGAERFATETLVRLPRCFLCYSPPPQSQTPEVGPLPAGESGPVTFGSFNAIFKTSPPTMRLWGRVMNAVPGSRLILKTRGLDDPDVARLMREKLAREGVPVERVELIGFAESLRDHLGLYGRIDIGLDCFPYTGTTTTCEAMWMGVPVVTMTGREHLSRVGEDLLRTVGLAELVASGQADYVERVAGLARDRARLASLRAGLRERMRRSELMDGPGMARAMEAAYRTMWRAWCAGVPRQRAFA